MDFDYCNNMYNASNASEREAQTGIENVTRAQYVRMCVNFRRAHDSDVSNILILPYGLIFLLSVVGNTMVILTLVRHKKMRTITNMYLINLALSDLLLAVFCMPFTLIPMLMEEFIFGPVLCVLIRYAQGKLLHNALLL
ncbi:cholecystokinin receptor type a [Plakobranchus ocellatus]|uniref:Cholecystokinin receptor type a n=1 Tax=Plakobranchus ocellatus TaxID=259542 RepID=A0AAV3YPN0_9GAST|nr:cholecystokinin receptor type a [Plakobranchus ocellatus]